MISPTTRLAVLLGDPVAHSRSPTMLNAAFTARKVDAVYLAWRVGAADLQVAIAALAATNALGANITVPHKELAMRAVDRLAEGARELQCINCITFRDGESTGHNTDAPGLLRALKAHRVSKVGPALILGAGGAARAAVVALIQLGTKEIHVVNRSASRRKSFAPFAKSHGVSVHAWDNLDALCAEARLIVNATSAQVKHEEITLPWSSLRKPAIYDLTYGRTALVRAAEQRGLKAFDGSRMLLEQAGAAFELWTGKKAPVAVMAKVLGD